MRASRTRPDGFLRAARALTGMTRCTISQARRAADAAWKANHDAAEFLDVYSWLGVMKPRILRLMKPAATGGAS